MPITAEYRPGEGLQRWIRLGSYLADVRERRDYRKVLNNIRADQLKAELQKEERLRRSQEGRERYRTERLKDYDLDRELKQLKQIETDQRGRARLGIDAYKAKTGRMRGESDRYYKEGIIPIKQVKAETGSRREDRLSSTERRERLGRIVPAIEKEILSMQQELEKQKRGLPVTGGWFGFGERGLGSRIKDTDKLREIEEQLLELKRPGAKDRMVQERYKSIYGKKKKRYPWTKEGSVIVERDLEAYNTALGILEREPDNRDAMDTLEYLSKKYGIKFR